MTVIDLHPDTIQRSIDTLKAQGFNPNCIMLLPTQSRDLRASRATE